jgi:hypothetical protein
MAAARTPPGVNPNSGLAAATVPAVVTGVPRATRVAAAHLAVAHGHRRDAVAGVRVSIRRDDRGLDGGGVVAAVGEVAHS